MNNNIRLYECRQVENLRLTTRQIENLTLLQALMQETPDDKFSPHLTRYFEGDARPSCGTVACAAGHAALHPIFNAKGLHIKCFSHITGKFWAPTDRAGQNAIGLTLLSMFGSHEVFEQQSHQDLRSPKQCVLDRIEDTFKKCVVVDSPYAKEIK